MVISKRNIEDREEESGRKAFISSKEAAKKMTRVIRQAASLANKKKYDLLKAQAEAEAEESRKKAAEAEKVRLQAEAEALRQEEAFQKISKRNFTKSAKKEEKRDNRRVEKYEF